MFTLLVVALCSSASVPTASAAPCSIADDLRSLSDLWQEILRILIGEDGYSPALIRSSFEEESVEPTELADPQKISEGADDADDDAAVDNDDNADAEEDNDEKDDEDVDAS